MDKYFGNMILIGGGEDKEKGCDILNRVIQEVNANNGPLILMSTASSIPEDVNNIYVNALNNLGFTNTKIMDIRSRSDAENAEFGTLIDSCGGIFFTGGDQLRITSILGGSVIHERLNNAFRRGVLIAGTSAGASCVCSTMISAGLEEASPQKCTIKMAPGLGFVSGVIVDQHFSQRGRLGRLLNAVAQNPDILGIGIDEDTAVVFGEENKFCVIGKGAVSVVDGRKIVFTNVSESKPDEVLAIENAILHVIPAGFTFDLNKRKLV